MDKKFIHYVNPKDNIKLELVQMGFHKTTPLFRCKPLVRDYFLIHFVVAGQGEIRSENKTYKGRHGECFIIPPNEMTEYSSDKDEPWAYYYLGFTGPDAARVVGRAGFLDYSPVLKVKHMDEIVETFGLLENAYPLAEDDSGMLICESIMYRVLHYLIKDGMEATPQVHREMAPTRRDYVNRGIFAIENSQGLVHSVAEIATALAVNKTYFGKIFKEETGMSVKGFIIKYRIGLAATKLRTSKKSIKEIAYAVGFEDPLYFSRVFKQHFGHSPSEYRNIR